MACRQLQVSTGPNSGMKPRHTGPYAVIALMKDKCSCIIESLATGNQSKEHYTNLIPINYHPDHNRVHSTFDEEIETMIDNLKNNRYNIKASTRRLLKIPISTEAERATQNSLQSDPTTSDPATQAQQNDEDQRSQIEADRIDQAEAGPSGLPPIASSSGSEFNIGSESDSDANYNFFRSEDEEISTQEYYDFQDDDIERQRKEEEIYARMEERERREPDYTQESESESED